MSTPPVDNLELRALQQRNQIHHTATELKEKVHELRERFDPAMNMRRHFGAAAAIVAALGLLTGYAAGGVFTTR